MYSGGSDSAESQNYSQWALINPSSFQNMSNEQVDWAALAQQWIIMKEAGPPPVISSSSIDPKSTKAPHAKKISLNEGGEAPMDMDDKDDSISAPWSSLQDAKSRPPTDWNWGAPNPSWGWNSNWNTAPSGVASPLGVKAPLLPTPMNYNQYTTAPVEGSSEPSFGNAPNGDHNPGYWTTAGNSKQIKPHNRRFSKVNVPRSVPTSIGVPVPEIQPLPTPTPTLDAAKRKQLPAWIREGLEKMEKEKLRQLEREKEQQQRDEYKEKLKQNEKETMEILKSTIQEQDKGQLDSDEEDSDGEPTEAEISQQAANYLSATELMTKVRRTMTEILLKVTNREIEQICREEVQRQQKYKASDHRVSAPSGANVTAKLGLGIYGDGSESSDTNESDNSSGDKRNSDSDLKESIKRKKADFHKTEMEIEEKLALGENRRQELKIRSTSPTTNANESQVDAKHQGRIKQRTPSTSQKEQSNNKKSTPPQKREKASTESSESSSPSTTRKKIRRRSPSTSSSSEKYHKKSTKKHKRRTKSRSSTPVSKDYRRNRVVKSRSRSKHSRKDSKERHKEARRTRSRSRSTLKRRSDSYKERSKNRYRRSRSKSRSRSDRRRSRRSSRSSSGSRGKKSRRR